MFTQTSLYHGSRRCYEIVECNLLFHGNLFAETSERKNTGTYDFTLCLSLFDVVSVRCTFLQDITFMVDVEAKYSKQEIVSVEILIQFKTCRLW